MRGGLTPNTVDDDDERSGWPDGDVEDRQLYESMLWIARPARHLSACHDHDGLNDSTGSWERDLIK